MAFTPISGVPVQYHKSDNTLASGYYLKFYSSDSTTAISMATSSTGTTLLSKCAINTSGYPINTSGGVFIPYLGQKYKIALYKNGTDADDNKTAAADWIVDGLPQFLIGTPSSITGYTATSEYKNGSEAVSNAFTLDNSFVEGTNNVLVFRNGQIMYSGATRDYIESSTNIITFNYSLNTDDVLLFIIGALATGTAMSSASVGYIADAAGAAASTVQSKLRQYVSAGDNGSVGDGVTENTSTLQSLVNAKPFIYVPPGTWRIASLELKGGAHLVGCGTSTKIYIYSSSVGITATGTAAAPLDTITIENMEIHGSTESPGGMVLTDVNRFRLINAKVYGFGGDGIQLNGSSDAIINGSEIDGNAGVGVLITESADIAATENNIIVNSAVTNNIGGGVKLLAVTAATTVKNNKVSNTRFDSNNVAGVSGYGITIDGASDTVIDGNPMQSAYDANILLTNAAGYIPDGTILDKNRFSDSTTPTQTYDIEITNANNTRIRDNTFVADVRETAGDGLVYEGQNIGLNRSPVAITNIGAGVTPGSRTSTLLDDVGDAINTADKNEGKMIFNSTLGYFVYAAGSAAADVWKKVSDNTTANTPV